MKSLIVNPVHNFEIVERETPKANGKRMVIKTKYVAICGSDNMLWNQAAGMALGHEFSGYVEDPGDFPFIKGQRVCAAEFNSCGECEFCKAGQEQLCAQMMLDNPGVTMDGGFGEYVSVRGDFVFPIPDEVPLELGAIVEPISVALHGVKYCNLKKGEDVLIWGNGPIGIYAAACAKLLGAGKVYMVGRNKGRVDFCNNFEFVDKCLSVKDEDFEEQLKAVTPVGGFAQVIDCLGVSNFDQMASVMKSGGRIVLLGMHSPTVSASAMALYLKEISVHTALYFTLNDYKEAVKMVCENPNVFMPTITSRVPHDAEAMQKMFIKLFESGSNDECKVLLEYKD